MATSYADYQDKQKKQQQDFALSLLAKNSPKNVTLVLFDHVTKRDYDPRRKIPPRFNFFQVLNRDAKNSISNNRDLPFVKDFFDTASKLRADVIGFINSDILIRKDFFSLFNKKIDAYVFSRIDIRPTNERDIQKGKVTVAENTYPNGVHDGADGFFFKTKWWNQNRHLFHDDLVLGEPYWDHYYRSVIRKNCRNKLVKHSVYHVWHHTTWTFDSPGAILNRNIWEDHVMTLNRKIPLNFGLFWSGTKLSYLRYLTFKSLRHFHPDAKIQLYVAKQCKKDGYTWWREKQDFEVENNNEDWMPKLKEIDVEIIEADMFPTYAPNFQSDFFRWWYLNSFGGFYLDTDQLILRNFSDLPLNEPFVFTQYDIMGYQAYAPVGVIGAVKESKIVNYITKVIAKYYDPNVYNCIGPNMLKHVLSSPQLREGVNVPSNLFYPIRQADETPRLYNGSIDVNSFKDSYALHWFGGFDKSQEFNNKFTPEFAATSDDSISKYIREMGWI